MPVISMKRRALAITAVLATGLSLFAAQPAQAAARDGKCATGEFCYSYNSGFKGSVSDFKGNVADYGAKQPGCYEFKSKGAGKGVCVKNHAAAVWNRTSNTAYVYFNSNYGTARVQAIPAGVKVNLNSKLKNNNASHSIGKVTKPAVKQGNDHPHKTRSYNLADPWMFYYRECTSFAAWTVRTRVGVTNFNNFWTNGKKADGGRFSNAKYWNDRARKLGVPVYSKPKAGDIAVREGGSAGHVAYVVKVNANGSFVVDEYNYNGGHAYGQRTTTPGAANSQFSSFIRFKK